MADIDKLAEEIVAAGVRQTFGIPGSGATLDLLDGLERRGVDFHLCHFEGAAAMMAATAGRLTGHAGIALSIKGPGLVNMLPGIAVSHFEAFPLVAIAEAYAENAPNSLAHKRIDQNKLVSAVVKGRGVYLSSGPPFSCYEAWSRQEEPGPIVLELQSSSDRPQPLELPMVKAITNTCSEAVAGRIRAAQRPIVVAGALSVRLGLGQSLSKLSVPVFTTAAAKGVVDERHMQAAGVLTGAGGPLTPESVIVPESDLVLGIGLNPKEFLKTAPFGVPTINAGVGSPVGLEGFGIDMHVGPEALPLVLDAMSNHAWGLDRVETIVHALDGRLGGGFLPGAVFVTIAAHFGHRVRLVMDTGSFCTVGEHIWKAPSPDLCLFSAQGRYMGTGIPMGVSASLVDRQVPTVVVVGDGGIGPYVSEMRLAVDAQTPLLLVLLTDGAFASIRTRALRDGLTQRPLTSSARSWVPVMAGFGMPSERIEGVDALQRSLGHWRPASGPLFLEIPFCPDAYEAMVHGIR